MTREARNLHWAKPWVALDGRRRAYIERELHWELSNFPDHPLSGVSFSLVAMKDPYTHAIAQLEDGRFAYVRLSWAKARPPQFEVIGDESELRAFLSRP